MKKYIVLLTLLLLEWAIAWGDRSNVISVLSFEMNPTDMEAMTNRVTDDSGDLTALIKIETTARGFEFDCGSMGVVEVNENHPGEVWVYVQQSASRITITHTEWGILRDYKFPTGDLIEGRTYVMKIATDRSNVDDATLIQSQFLEIQVYPLDAIVEIDGERVDVTKKGVATKWVAIGKHDYRVSAKGFRPMPGVADVNDVHNKTIVKVRLKPAVGYVKVMNVFDYSGATIYIDNGKVGTMPMDSVLMESGTHSVRISKKMYKPFVSQIEVEDEKTTTVVPTLETNYAHVTIKGLEQETEIWANGQLLGNGTWEGRLESGYTVIEARKKGYNPTRKVVEIGIGIMDDIVLTEPHPAYGSLSVICNKKGAKVMVDGIVVGKTPLTDVKMLMGEHNIKIEKKGYQTLVEEIEIEEGKLLALQREMTKARAVEMECNVEETTWWVDGTHMDDGINMNTWLGEGRHIVKLTANGYDDYTTILEVGKGKNSYECQMTPIMPDTLSFTVNKVTFNMIRVKGGCFDMGNENGTKAEMPQHAVTLNSYYISETEVTQELWMAVTGISVDALRKLFDTTTDETKLKEKGNDMPMYFVSWDDCQNFLEIISSSTGKKFQLPTEAQWEYAVRGGMEEADTTQTEFWCFGNSEAMVHQVATLKPNVLGLYDMQGSVWEWCRDTYNDYTGEAQTNPVCLEKGDRRVIRGGSWANYNMACRPTFRMYVPSSKRSNRIGFRLVIEIINDEK